MGTKSEQSFVIVSKFLPFNGILMFYSLDFIFAVRIFRRNALLKRLEISKKWKPRRKQIKTQHKVENSHLLFKRGLNLELSVFAVCLSFNYN